MTDSLVTPDISKVDAFAGKVLGDVSSSYATLMCAIGDRLGLFQDLSASGPATSEELAEQVGINERYAREWLAGLTCAGYLEYDETNSRFRLPPEHARVLVEEGGVHFMAGMHQSFLAESKNVDRLTDAFKRGGGVSPEAFDEGEWIGTERMTASWFENLPVWIPAVPRVKAALEGGASVADVGCGRGRALITLAQAFPKSHYVGYDIFGPAVEHAAENAKAKGVSDRVVFHKLDVANGLPQDYDLITTFDVIHDLVNPLRVLQVIRNALKPGGTYLMLEINCKERLEDNKGPFGALAYGWSLMYCMTTSLAQGGMGLGTMGLPESRVREICARAGFRAVRPLPIDNPFNVLYEVVT